MICGVSVSRLLGFVKLRIDVWMNDRFLELFTRMLTSKRMNIKPKKRRTWMDSEKIIQLVTQWLGQIRAFLEMVMHLDIAKIAIAALQKCPGKFKRQPCSSCFSGLSCLSSLFCLSSLTFPWFWIGGISCKMSPQMTCLKSLCKEVGGCTRANQRLSHLI